MYKKFSVSLTTAFLIFFLSAPAAQAWFRFKNKTSQIVWVAFSWHGPGCNSSGNWHKKGWWKLLPQQTKTVYSGDLRLVNASFYWYAEGSNGSVWNGPFETCTPSTAFDWCDNTCNNAEGTRILGYREKDVPFTYANYTINLTN